MIPHYIIIEPFHHVILLLKFTNLFLNVPRIYGEYPDVVVYKRMERYIMISASVAAQVLIIYYVYAVLTGTIIYPC